VNNLAAAEDKKANFFVEGKTLVLANQKGIGWFVKRIICTQMFNCPDIKDLTAQHATAKYVRENSEKHSKGSL